MTAPATVWLAIDLFPEAMEVHVASDRAGALDAVKDTIVADDWNSFQAGLARNGEPGADLTLNDPTELVLAQYWGEFEDAEGHGEGAVFIGEGWLIKPANVRP